jgi:hypothetical protein
MVEAKETLRAKIAKVRLDQHMVSCIKKFQSLFYTSTVKSDLDLVP